MSVLITGVNGSLGYALKEVLLQSSFPQKEPITFLTSQMCDLTNEDEVLRTFQRIKPRLVVHLAALSGGLEISKKSPALLIQKNLKMTINLMLACANSGTKRVIMTSSVAAYPFGLKMPAKEIDFHSGPPSDVDFAYAYAKRMMDPIAKAFELEYGILTNVLVVNGIIGPKMHFGDERAVMIAGLIQRFSKATSTEELLVLGDGENIREYTYSFDLARAILYFMENRVEERIINIGNNLGYSIRKYAEMVADSLNLDRGRIAFQDAVVPNKIRHDYRTNNELFLTMSKFQYTDFQDALAATIAWYLKDQTVLKNEN